MKYILKVKHSFRIIAWDSSLPRSPCAASLGPHPPQQGRHDAKGPRLMGLKAHLFHVFFRLWSSFTSFPGSFEVFCLYFTHFLKETTSFDTRSKSFMAAERRVLGDNMADEVRRAFRANQNEKNRLVKPRTVCLSLHWNHKFRSNCTLITIIE